MIKKLLKSEKGANLLTLTIAIMVILVLTNVIILNVKDNLKIEKLKALQTDIVNLRDKVSNYYAEFGAVPIVDVEYTNIDNIKNARLISETVDTGRFYAIDLKRLEGLTLNYGKDYSKITDTSTAEQINGYTDLYIINSASHNIFYVQGVKIDGKMYYTDYLAEDIDTKSVALKFVDNVPIPKDFYYVDGSRDTGLIISDAEGDDTQNSKKGNQYVWVPVDDFNEFIRQDFGRQNIASTYFVDTGATSSSYYEAKSDGISAQTEVEKMYRSVKDNKGFYIARFEAGYENGVAVSKKDIQVSNSVNWSTANTRATNAYPESKNGDVVSTLCYGVQWDAIMRWISKDANLAGYLKNSGQGGNYTNSGAPALTGVNDNYQVKNIYDLAGNVEEWTKEMYSTSYYVTRGGSYSTTTTNYKTMASRQYVLSSSTSATRGFRTALYITADASLNKMPTESSTANSTTTIFSTNYGRIDVVWLDKNNNVIANPEPPILTASNGQAMTPVTWTESRDSSGNITSWTEDSTANSNWYNYTAGAGTDDNLTSRWANAKTANGSYFVWIPRYAYRITYYENETSTEPTGYYDGWGMWKASDGKLKYKLDTGIQTVKHNGTKYIVHPAFETDLDNGGWLQDLSGFWVAKYEMSGSGSTSGTSNALKSVPNVVSLHSGSIGNHYRYARNANYGHTGVSESISSGGTTYSHTSFMYSHLMKNSEWGAVAYLAHSQYGRNGYEIDINNSSSYITGNGGGSPNTTSQVSGTTNAYNTAKGAKASTTGNVYGIYDMSGGAVENLAIFNKNGSSSYINNSSYGMYMTQEAKNSSGTYISTKYITAYSNSGSLGSGNNAIYTVGKIGDATKEVNQGGGMPGNNTSYYSNWFNDSAGIVTYNSPAILRGFGYASSGGTYYSSSYIGLGYECSFHTVLCPQ